MEEQHTGTTNRNLRISNSIFAPTLAAAIFLIGFLCLRPATMTGESIIGWAALGCLVATLIGFGVGYALRDSELLNLILRWLIMALVVFLIAYALFESMSDLRLWWRS